MSNIQKKRKQHSSIKGYFSSVVCILVSVLFLFGLGFISSTYAGMLVYPAKGQSPEQQKKDEFECHQWAVQQTGYDPTTAQQAPQQQTSQGGGVARGAAGGALVGVGVGAIAGDAGKGAAIGATTGAIARGARQSRQRQQQQAANQQAQSQQQAQIDHYNKAKGVCLEGRGYTVR